MQALIIYLLIFIAIIILLLYAQVSKVAKISIAVFLGFVIISAAFYEISASKKEEKNREIINAFKQNKEIVCDGQIVTAESFRLDTGTMSFVAKAKEKSGVIYSLSDCALK